MRLFIGIPMPAGAFETVTRQLQATLPAFRPVTSGTWHVTLRFLGEEFDLPGLEAAITKAVQNRPPMPCVVEALGCFPKDKAANVLWAGIRAHGIDNLATAIEDATKDFGEAPEKRRFVAHATLGRLPKPVDVRSVMFAHKDTLFAKGTLDRVVLYDATLTKAGSQYDVVRTWRLSS